MKLNKLHICHAATGTPTHRDAIARRDVGIRCVKINLARAACGEHGMRRADGHHFVGGFVEHICAIAALLVAP